MRREKKLEWWISLGVLFLFTYYSFPPHIQFFRVHWFIRLCPHTKLVACNMDSLLGRWIDDELRWWPY